MAALDTLAARLALASSGPVGIGGAGSSTTFGTGASTTALRYFNQVIADLQEAHPNGATESTVLASNSATFTKITTPGVHGYNLGEGGTTASTFFTESERTAVAALGLDCLFIMIGSNDYSFNVAPATYKSNLQTVITDFHTKSPGTILVLIHSFQRLDVTGTYPWEQYRQALVELAQASPDYITFIDASHYFEANGVPGADPLNLVASDNIHPTDDGHTRLAESIFLQLGRSSGWAEASFTLSAGESPVGDSDWSYVQFVVTDPENEFPTADSGWAEVSFTVPPPKHPIGVWNGTNLVSAPLMTWDGTTLRL